MNTNKTTTIKLSKSLQALLDEIPDSRLGPKKFEFSPEADAFLLAGWPVKMQSEMAKAFKRRFGAGTQELLRARYRELTEGKA